LLELLVVIAIISILASMLMPALSRARESARRVSCVNNLRQIGMSFRMYADESHGRYPRLRSRKAERCKQLLTCDETERYELFVFDGRSVYPEYLPDAEVLVCPSDLDGPTRFEEGVWSPPPPEEGLPDPRYVDPCLLTPLSYLYVPWVIRTDWILDNATFDLDSAFSDGLVRTAFGRGEGDWRFEDEEERDIKVPYMRQGVSRFLITDINNPAKGYLSESRIPVMFDMVSIIPERFNHVPGGGNVQYMDGHVEFERYPSRKIYPVSTAWAFFVDHQTVPCPEDLPEPPVGDENFGQ